MVLSPQMCFELAESEVGMFMSAVWTASLNQVSCQLMLHSRSAVFKQLNITTFVQADIGLDTKENMLLPEILRTTRLFFATIGSDEVFLAVVDIFKSDDSVSQGTS